MADNNIIDTIGSRFHLVDPNNFNNQRATGLFGDPNYNISVPNEDLSIMVELVTQTKDRTILNTKNNRNTVISTKNGNMNVSFIDGSKNNSTGGKNFLTTSYTDMFTEMKDVDEAFGITSIDIDFNSSYAPMVNINFIDIKGAGLFQMGAQSQYSVLFRLPYPIFELTVKGFYGKPVKYCLHMLKCNTKFNSSSGNFEISAQFVGYSYAMLSDMLLGYIKAAALTPTGQDLMKARGMISIKDFMKKVSNINGRSLEDLLGEEDVDAANLSNIENIKSDLASMKNLIFDAINSINHGTLEVYEVPDTNYNGATLSQTIAIVKDPNPQTETTLDERDESNTIHQNYNNKIVEKIKAYNLKVDTIQDLKLDEASINMLMSNISFYYSGLDTSNTETVNWIKRYYDIDGDNDAQNIINRLKDAALNAKDDTSRIIIYDVTDALLIINGLEKKISLRQAELVVNVGEKLKNAITAELGFDTTIRSIVRMFTVHIEVFLEQLFNVSSQYDKDEARKVELQIFQNTDGAKKIDVKEKDTVKNIIYPWPEYQENGVEKYLGSKKGRLKNPLNVPEIKFVEELFEAMKRQEAAEDELNNLEDTSVPAWLSFNPIDSWYFNQSEKNPYSRLPDSGNHDDFARLAVLRAVGYMGFSNKFLDVEEIKTFAKQEAALIVDKLKDDTNGIIKALNLNYDSPNKYANVTGKITDAYGNLKAKVLDYKNIGTESTPDNVYRYRYIMPDTTGSTFVRLSLPVSKDFTDADYNGANEFTHGYTLSNAVGDAYKFKKNKDGVSYIHILTKEEYENPSDLALPSTQTSKTFVAQALAKDMSSFADLEAAGFAANSGKYGVQAFLKIDHGITKDAPFFTLFYNRGNENQTPTTPSMASPLLCRPRDAGAVTQFDINQSSIQLPTTTVFTGRFTEQEAMNTDGYLRINEIYNKRKDIYENISLTTEYSKGNTNVRCPFFNFNVWHIDHARNKVVVNINLFGSRFYNAQKLEGKAFLFLHCFPWRGLTGGNGDDGGPFGIKEIINVFKNRTGFIQVPKYFPAFIGGVLKRDRVNEILKFKVTVGDEEQDLIPGSDGNLPSRIQFLVNDTISLIGVNIGYPAIGPMTFNDGGYINIGEIFEFLPYEAEQAFIKEFDAFVIEYDTMRDNFEIHPDGYTGDEDDDSWTKAFDKISDSVEVSSDELKASISLSNITSYLTLANEKSFDETFNVFSFIPNQPNNSFDDYEIFKYNYFIEYKDGSDSETKLRDAIISYKYLSNESIFIWDGIEITTMGGKNVYYTQQIDVSEANWNLYFDEFKNLVSNEVSKIEENKKFLTTDQEEIKLEIYRNLKKTYDKWIAFSDTKERIIFQCCARGSNTPIRLPGDTKLQNHRGGKEIELIDSFRFVDSFFKDIGDDFNINPFTVSQMLHETTNTSFYSFLSRILTDNNFDFIALPTFVDYNDPKEVLDIFKPYPYYEAKNLEAPSGPSFVCVYVGQTSTKLDFGDGDLASQYPNDGFDLSKDCINCPDGVKVGSNGKGDWEDIAAAFVIKYGHQNQNYFKDIILDQAEFGATAESLEITDALSNSLSDSNKAFYGQNLYDVYSVRSYKVEVEMMGDAMVQPMMYFQLDNMPMFHGAYLITHVKHSIKPNYMSTVFNGTRIKSTQTPLIDAAALYGALIGTFALPGANGALSNRTSGSYPPIVATIIGNGSSNGDIIQGNITMKKIPVIDGVYNSKATAPNKRDSMLTEATDAFEVMVKDFVTYAKANNYPTLSNDGKTYLGIMSLFRGVAYQKVLYDDMLRTKGRDDGSVAKPGRSNHGWGIAVDLQYIDKSNSWIRNSTSNVATGFDINKNPSLRWFLDNGFLYGFMIPYSLRDSRGTDEFWHFEYHGTSAQCLFLKHPDVRGYRPNISGAYKPIVINPLDSTNKRAIYDSNNCDFVTISTGDGTESTSTIETGQKADNQVEVKKYLKDVLNYSKEAAAGIMGNIEQESHFDPVVTPFDDLGGYKSYGLMQWNSQFVSPTAIGTTVKSQMDYYAVDTDAGRKTFNDIMAQGNVTAYMAAYYFAKYYERCANCTGTLDLYSNATTQYTPNGRSLFANDFFKRFNNPADRLYWDGDGTQAAATTAGNSIVAANTTSIIIGDSIVPTIETEVISAGGKARKLGAEGESSLWKVGIGVSWVLNAVKKYPVNTNVTSVVISIGTNDAFSSTSNVKGLFNQMKTTFPNSKIYVVQGEWGWGGVIDSTEADLDTYYARWKNLGAILLEPKLGKQTAQTAHNKTAATKAIGEAIAAAGA